MDCSKCAGCPIEGWYKPYEPHTYKNAQFFVVVDRITATGQKEDRDIPKGTRNMFIRHAQNEQFQPDQFAFHPHTLCAYDEAELTNKEQDNVRKHCRVHMLDAIEKYQPDAVLSMGAEATKQALGRNVQITKVRGLGQDDADGVDVVVMPVLHPGQALRFPEQEPFLASDMAAFGRLVDAGFDTKKAGDVQAGKYEVVMDLQKLIDMDPDDIAFDTETTGLDWFRKGLNVRSYNPKEHKGAGWFRPGFQILCMSFTVAPGNKSYIIPWDQPDFPMPESMKPRIRNQLRKLMCKPGRKITGHNCVTPDTEVLTKDGWLRVDEYAGQDIMQWDPATKGMGFVQPSAYIEKHHKGDIYEWDSQMLSQAVTPEHRMYVSKAVRRDVYSAQRADEVGKHSPNSTYLPLSGVYQSDSEIQISAAEARVMEAIRADGHIEGQEGTTYVDWKFKKARKIAALRLLLDDCGIPYYETEMVNGVTRIRTRKDATIERVCALFSQGKVYGPWVLDLPVDARLAILHEAKNWDGGGYQSEAGGYSLSTADESTAVWFQAMAHATGWRYTYTARKNDRGYSLADGVLYTGTVTPRGDAKLQKDAKVKEYDGMVYCFTVPTSAFLVRRNGRVSVTGNCKFDNVALWMTEGIRFEIGGDSNVLASLYDENAMQKDLASMTKIHVPEIAGYSDWFDAKYDKSRMWEVPWEDMVPYVGGDTIAAYKLERALYNKVAEDAGNINYYHRVSLPGLNAFASIETRGMKVDDKVALPTFQAYLTEDVEKRRVALLEQIPGSIKRKHVAEYKGSSDPLSLSRAGFMIDVLFEHPDGFQLKPQVFTKSTERLDSKRQVPSTSSKDHLPYFFDDEPFTRELAEYIKLNDLLNKSVNNFQMKYLVDGYVRPKYSISKTVTRRTSSMDPNGQNFPKRGQMAMTYQRMFTAPKGWYVISVDLSQAEIRVAGEMARDKVITQIYKQNGDIHVSTALIVAGITEEAFYKLHKTEQKLLRQKAKAVNFGFLYGMGWRKFIGYAKTDYGVEFTEREAKRIRDGFFKKYPGLANWHERTKKFVRAHKHVRSMSGLVRHLPMIDSPDEGTQASAERMAINSPVQEFASSIGVAALGRMEKEVNPYYLKMIGFIHDALVAYVRMQHVAWGMRTIKYYLENTPLEEWFGTKMNIPILAEPSFGLNMGEMIELPSFKMDEDFDFWNHPDMMDKDGKPILDVPPQEEPEDDGWRHDSPYTDWQYEEDEDVGDTAVVTRPRQVRSVEAAPAPRKVVMRKPKLQSIAQEETEALIKRVSRRRR